MAKGASLMQMPSEQNAAVVQSSFTFPWQSYFDTALLEKAIVVQPPGSLIVAAQKEEQYGGHAIILHRSSQVPIAISAKGSGSSSPTTYVLAPGQSISALGDRPIRSFIWGLPFGWLGGGMAQLLVGQQTHEPTFGMGIPEIPFHRARFAIKQPADLTSIGYNNSPLNWPIRFPWVQSQNLQSVKQPGSPLLAPTPSRICMVLRNSNPAFALADPAAMRIIIEGADDFNLDAGGAPGVLDQAGSALTLSYPIFDEVYWPQWAQIGAGGNLAVQNPELSITPFSTGGQALLRLGCSGIPQPTTPTAVGVTFVDDSGGSLAGCYVDVVRYGRL